MMYTILTIFSFLTGLASILPAMITWGEKVKYGGKSEYLFGLQWRLLWTIVFVVASASFVWFLPYANHEDKVDNFARAKHEVVRLEKLQSELKEYDFKKEIAVAKRDLAIRELELNESAERLAKLPRIQIQWGN